MSFYYLHILVFTKCPDILLYVLSQFSVYRFSPVLGCKYDVILAHPLGMCQTLRLVCHTSHLSFCNRPEHPYCSRKVFFLYNFFPSTRIAGGFLFRFDQLLKGTNKNAPFLRCRSRDDICLYASLESIILRFWMNDKRFARESQLIPCLIRSCSSARLALLKRSTVPTK